MQNGITSVTYQTLTNTANELNSKAGQMETCLSNVKAQLNQIGNDDVWASAEASEVRATFDELSNRFNDYSEAVRNCAQFLNNYVADLEKVNSSIRSGL